jgi:hypothetical protein
MQRVLFAGLLLQDWRLIVLDEPSYVSPRFPVRRFHCRRHLLLLISDPILGYISIRSTN